MFFYKQDNKYLFSFYKYDNLHEITEKEAKDSINDEIIYFLNRLDTKTSKRSFCISSNHLLEISSETINNILCNQNASKTIPYWFKSKIEDKCIKSINTNYKGWEQELNKILPRKYNINIVGLGDVGSNLLIGLKLLGNNIVSNIGIYGFEENNLKRLHYEINQIYFPFQENTINVNIIDKEDLFNCDLFIFCASKSVPPLNSSVSDVRMIQFEGNKEILKEYANLVAKYNFKGIFAVVSDPVDYLCKALLYNSNLLPEQIIGYGLGVMNARAVYYSKQRDDLKDFENYGRVYGPHGKDLIVANNIFDYDEELSLYLTQKTINANIDVRNTGYKPYIAPSLSSGAISILSTLTQKWHYSSVFIGGVYMGVKNRLLNSGLEIESIDMNESLFKRIQNTYNNLNMEDKFYE